ncbi:branched-chain amino acid ABC transporter substrate-binding protein [Pseudonocardia sp. KRD-184]|uniref:Branched-chain amino acid ABC transporter substrate-binding protein n=1 Tax=Pseudonocardia oceani TaxID=2792013 RepID=A0ABS6UGZ1_9PSEU|nr:branched-chain amino acid ABC transporter substrate-binding protein [Pseudonocardia oceani]MBW0091450.1 branched-chain amino acid ABC transporter substrate-binding protein [Pseudonocardia oceani]MBW0096212.1 branched-chain amino acid ABC transporter substrate-binding protein [Pseudonocardia oceani]MBW0111077.1 branched-chain amino acid ABC transporter substrate-binding protein [Pseudonocardia oceani]MBW0120104.1 branched-chain amino acid ABC transporter substrate-binding protein [Pseudonocar
MSRRRAVVTAAILAGGLVLSACGTNREEGGGAAGGACDTSKGTLVVGMVAPLSGPLSALGLGMQNSADLAVDQANQNCTVPGYALRLQAEDDQSQPAIAANAATRLASDPNVVGVVGTLNSSTAQTVQPILLERGIVQISPANTNPTLTQGEAYETAPARAFSNYFRVATTDAVQGPFGAQYLVNTAGKKRIAVIDDGKTYGAGLAAAFAAEATRLGAEIVFTGKVGENDTDFSGVVTQVRAATPDAVYYGGEYPAAGPLSAQIAQGGLDIPVMGGDALINAEYVPLGGRVGDLGTSVGAPAEDLDSAQQFITDYEAANYVEGFETYGALTYDSTNIIINSLVTALNGGDWSEDTRAAVVEAVQATDYQGAAGPVTFDEFGDTTNKLLTVYTVEGDAFVPLETGTYEG